jgi:protein arginine N-methyltransferase 1
MYSIAGYGSMIADRLRLDAYAQALRQAVRPGSVVVDIGTGTGIFALLACQFGARKVYAIEPSDAIQVAREIAVANGYGQRIEFMQNLSTEITLPERADVIISDLRGVFPLFKHHIPAIADARQRLLAPGGVMIPQRDTLWAAVVEAPELYSRLVAPWDENSYGLDMQPARQIVTNTWCKGRVAPEQLLVEPKCWATLDYTMVDSPHVGAHVTWTVARAGTAHGFLLWFDATLTDGVHFSNTPGEPELIYGSTFVPLSRPVPLAACDTVSVVLQAKLVGDDYIWRWNTRVHDCSGPVKAHFEQSTFYGVPRSPARLRKRAGNHVPVLNDVGKVDRLILELMSDNLALTDIARRISVQFPTRFVKWQDALARVAELSEKYSH